VTDNRPFSFEQSQNMRTAIDMVMEVLKDDSRRGEVANLVLALINEQQYHASKIANLALLKLGYSNVVEDDRHTWSSDV
jgi:hypothetical protein